MLSITTPELKHLAPFILLLALGCNQARYQPADWKTRENPPINSSGLDSEDLDRQQTEELLLTRFGQLTPWLDPRLSTGQVAGTDSPPGWTGSTLPVPGRSSTLPLTRGDLRGGIAAPRNSTLPSKNGQSLPGRTGSTLPFNPNNFRERGPARMGNQSTLPLPPADRPVLRSTNNRNGSTLPAPSRVPRNN